MRSAVLARHRLVTAEESYQRREKQLAEENSRLRDEFRDRMKRYQVSCSSVNSITVSHGIHFPLIRPSVGFSKLFPAHFTRDVYQ